MPPAPPPSSSRRKRVVKKSCLTRLYAFDGEVRQAYPARTLLGLDEVGRGSAIGPVVACAASLPETLCRDVKRALRALNDSKQVKPEERAQLAQWLSDHARVALGEASAAEVDAINVYHASLLAIRRAHDAWLDRFGAEAVDGNPPFLLIDGHVPLPGLDRAGQRPVIKGDGKSAVIAAASVVAKQHRDAMIRAWALTYPDYGWETNIGYLTPVHREAIARLGLTPHHRRSFSLCAEAEAQLSLSLG